MGHSMDDNNLLLEVKDLKTHFFTDSGVVQAVNGVTFQIERGKTLGVLGESGCGKSVTGFSMLRLVRPPGRIVEGQILYHRWLHDEKVETIDLTAFKPNSREIRQMRGAEIAMIFQEPMTSLDPLYTVGNQISESIIYHQEVSKQEARAIAIEMLDKVRMPQPGEIVDKYPHQLSGGMRQRVMIAMALSCRPALLIADEPTTALDVTTEAQILDLMRDLQQDLGMAIMFITHDLGVIAEMAENAVVMYLGRVVEQADIDTLFNAPQHPYTQALLKSVPKLGQKTGHRLAAIEGMVPAPHEIPTGCSFHPRCPAFMPGVCDAAQPPLIPLSGNHLVRCFLYENAQSGGVHNG